jgi:hypothetical protein
VHECIFVASMTSRTTWRGLGGDDFLDRYLSDRFFRNTGGQLGTIAAAGRSRVSIVAEMVFLPIPANSNMMHGQAILQDRTHLWVI